MSFYALDVGNSDIVFGVMDEDRIRMSCLIKTDRFKTADEYAVIFRNLLMIHEIEVKELEGGIISSVVPSLKMTMQDAMCSITHRKSLIVGPGLKSGLKIRIDDPAQLGSDRVAEAVAAIAEYAAPMLIFNMGTATTCSVIDEEGAYTGMLIMPGALMSLDALIMNTSLLPNISLIGGPNGVVGKNTQDSIVNGTFFGNAAVLDGLAERISGQFSEEPVLLATGGVSGRIIPYCRKNILYDENLLLKGLRILYLKNCRRLKP
ncbi:MAG: type III pantothenate kinase [Eubacterium sp.]|nr:type III pantothenate kinase [Eubacterium sp.]